MNFFFLREIPIGTGIGKTIFLLRDRGLLSFRDIEMAGRSNDKKFLDIALIKEKISFEDNNKYSFYIDEAFSRTDNYGRILTTKQAFGELCYNFHGKGPSMNRQRKRVNQYILGIIRKKKSSPANIYEEISNII